MSNSWVWRTVAHQDHLIHGLQRILGWAATFASGNLPDPRIEPRTPALQEDSFTKRATREAQMRTAARNKELNIPTPRLVIPEDIPEINGLFYFTSSLLPSVFYKRTWNPDPDKIGILRC